MHLISLDDQDEGGILIDKAPDGCIILAIQGSNGHMMALLTSKEARQCIQSLATLLMSQGELIAPQEGFHPAPAASVSPEGGGRSS